MSDKIVTGAELARWCYENPNLAASTIEGLRGPGMTKEERDLLLIIARIVLAKHNSSGPGQNEERNELRKAIEALTTPSVSSQARSTTENMGE